MAETTSKRHECGICDFRVFGCSVGVAVVCSVVVVVTNAEYGGSGGEYDDGDDGDDDDDDDDDYDDDDDEAVPILVRVFLLPL